MDNQVKQIKSQVQLSNVFKIKTIKIREFNFKQVGELTQSKKIEIKQGIGVDVTKDKNVYTIQSRIDILLLQDKKEIFYVKSAIIGAIDVEQNFDEKFLSNMVAIMYSYLRPLVAQMTVMAKLPPLDLPPLNFENFKVSVKGRATDA